LPEYPVIRFARLGNESINDYFTRTKVLSYTQGTVITDSSTITAGQFLVTVADTTLLFPGQILIKTSGTGTFADSAVTIVSEYVLKELSYPESLQSDFGALSIKLPC